MNIIDIGIIGILAFGAIIGLKRGFTTQLLSFVGFIIVVILAFMFKNPVSSFLYEYLPFFRFEGLFKGVTVLNIALYEVVAFFILFALLMIALKLLLSVTRIFEKVLKMTIILGIPSKILGAIVGVLEYYIIVFMLLYMTTLPFFNWDIVKESKLRPYILEKTPFLSEYTEKPLMVMNEFSKLMELYKDSSNPDDFNLAALDLFLKYDVIDIDSVVKLYEGKKLQVGNFYEVICKYEEEYCK
ncbi:MAG: CvpA family protein [Ignavibacteriales bacterium]